MSDTITFQIGSTQWRIFQTASGSIRCVCDDLELNTEADTMSDVVDEVVELIKVNLEETLESDDCTSLLDSAY